MGGLGRGSHGKHSSIRALQLVLLWEDVGRATQAAQGRKSTPGFPISFLIGLPLGHVEQGWVALVRDQGGLRGESVCVGVLVAVWDPLFKGQTQRVC